MHNLVIENDNQKHYMKLDVNDMKLDPLVNDSIAKQKQIEFLN